MDLHEVNSFSQLVDNLKIINLSEIGSNDWLCQVEVFKKMNMKVIEKVLVKNEGSVRSLLMTSHGTNVMLQEILGIFVWKYHLYPKIQESNQQNLMMLLLRLPFQHEYNVVALLDHVSREYKYHRMLKEYLVELLHYIVTNLHNLVTDVVSKEKEPACDPFFKETDRLNVENEFKIRLRCLSILKSILLHCRVSRYCLSLRKQMNDSNLPTLLMKLIITKPWMQVLPNGTVKKFIGEQWSDVPVEDMIKICEYDENAWQCLKLYFMKGRFISERNFRKWFKLYGHKCLLMINKLLVEQVGHLNEFRQYLVEHGLKYYQTIENEEENYEEEPFVIMSPIYRRFGEDFPSSIIERQQQIFLKADKQYLFNVICRINSIYSDEYIAKLKNLVDDAALQHVENSNGICRICQQRSVGLCTSCLLPMYSLRERNKRMWCTDSSLNIATLVIQGRRIPVSRNSAIAAFALQYINLMGDN